ncbi:hypothetical protein DITRI_Ditri19aG0031400 [Diplodiscus trichospermus]
MGAYMDLIGRLECVNAYGKRQCRSLFWRMKAALKKAGKSRSQHHFNFQYDPSSYALNFDDGCCHSGVGTNTMEIGRFQSCSECKNIMWVYVLCVKS